MIAILLSTYNGKNYIKQQLDSLVSQTYKELEIIVRDDRSTDNTLEILKSYDIKLVDSTQNLGAKKSFASLLEYAIENSDAEYFMFCDQDDIWEKDKIEKTLNQMKSIEQKKPNTPILVHSDLKVVDENLNIISDSLWKYQNIDPEKDSLNRVLLHNVVTGCSTMINRKLALLIKDIPNEAIMHDWWIAMVASVFGKISYVNEPLMLYRQHEKNDTGAKQYGVKYFINRFLQKTSVEKYILQAKAFLDMYEEELDSKTKQLLIDFTNIQKQNCFQKRIVLFKYKIFKNGLIRNIGLLLSI